MLPSALGHPSAIAGGRWRSFRRVVHVAGTGPLDLRKDRFQAFGHRPGFKVFRPGKGFSVPAHGVNSIRAGSRFQSGQRAGAGAGRFRRVGECKTDIPAGNFVR